MNDSENTKSEKGVNRRDALKTMGAVAIGAAATAIGAASSATAAAPGATPAAGLPQNPYGGKPNTGITLPPYYRPTPSVANANTFFPGMEELGDDEMRI
jgi:ribonuclease Z